MKKIIIFFLQISFISCQTNKDLYLLFEKVENKMFIYEESLNLENTFKIYTYKIKVNKEFEDIFFDSKTSYEKGIYLEKEGKYKTKLHQKAISLTDLVKYDVKDYKWLEEKINSFTPFQALYQFYDNIYIVQINSINKRAIITQVNNVEIIE